MVKTRPTPPWVIRLLRHCSAAEQFALSSYRSEVGKAHSAHSRGLLDHAGVTRIWIDALNQLADAAQGSPPLDGYLKRQLQHLENWAAEGAAA